MSTTTLPSHLHQRSLKAINAWLSGLNDLPLECDGMSRYLSFLLHRDGIAHQVHHGRLSGSAGESINHLWISLNENYVIDLRARMWMGEKANHGIFMPSGIDTKYEAFGFLNEGPMDDFLLTIMTGRSPDTIPAFPLSDVAPAKLLNNDEKDLLLDASGNPLLVFRGEHGVSSDALDLQTALGSYSFSTASTANAYAQHPNRQELWADALAQPRVMPCYLKMTNPVFANTLDPLVDFTDLEALFDRDFATSLFLRFSDYAENTNAFLEAAEAVNVRTIQELAQQHPKSLDQLCIQIFPLLDDHQFIQDCVARGYDGAMYQGSGESLDAVEYRVFNKDQVVYCLSPVQSRPVAIEREHAARIVRDEESSPTM